MSDVRENFSTVKKEVNTHRSYVRKKRRSKTSERRLMQQIWFMMVDRCTNPSNPFYYRYGGRGISVCDNWRMSFEAFRKDMGIRPSMFHSIERKDNDADYCKNNCKWATPTEQTRNKRCNRWVEYRGERLIITDLANKYGLNYATLHSRIVKRGWSVDRAVEEQSRHGLVIYYNGELFTQRGLCRKLGIKQGRLQWYIRNGISLKSAFEICLSRPAKEGSQS